MTTRHHHRIAECKAGLQNKFYEVEAEEKENGCGIWTFRWGRIGTKGQEKSGETLTFDSAKHICDLQIETKCSKGYREVTAMEAIASAVEDISERPVNGLQPVSLEIPTLWSSNAKTNARCVRYAEKYLDKLNIIRKSHNDLGYEEYEKQVMNLITAACEEWKRIRRTEAHKSWLDEESKQIAVSFLKRLADLSAAKLFCFRPWIWL